MNALFDYLLERSIAGSQPKENEIALDVFGRSATSDLGQDAIVRVNVHRLRRKLQSHYHQAGRDSRWQLIIPTGEYRLDIIDRDATGAKGEEVEEEPATVPRLKRLLPWGAGAVVVLGAVALVLTQIMPRDTRDDSLSGLAPWSDVAQRSSRVIIAVSDFPLSPADGNAGDLPADSASRREALSDSRSRYLPIGAAMSLRAILPVVSRLVEQPKTLNVVPISQLTPGMIVNSDIIYVGYINGLDILRDIVFAQSRFMPGETAEELIDQQTGRRYRADPFTFADGEKRTNRRDYSLIMSFPGPTGGRLIILAGTGDTGMIQASETATDPAALSALLAKIGSAQRFEALYGVETIGNRNLHARLLVASELPAFSWDVDSREAEIPAR